MRFGLSGAIKAAPSKEPGVASTRRFQMPNDQSKPRGDQPSPTGGSEAEAVARDTGATAEQVARLSRVTEDGTELEDAAAAAARWS
jgi:hypothetical protein